MFLSFHFTTHYAFDSIMLKYIYLYVFVFSTHQQRAFKLIFFIDSIRNFGKLWRHWKNTHNVRFFSGFFFLKPIVLASFSYFFSGIMEYSYLSSTDYINRLHLLYPLFIYLSILDTDMGTYLSYLLDALKTNHSLSLCFSSFIYSIFILFFSPPFSFHFQSHPPTFSTIQKRWLGTDFGFVSLSFLLPSCSRGGPTTCAWNTGVWKTWESPWRIWGYF